MRYVSLQWCYNECDGISNHQLPECLLKRRWEKTSKLRITGLCEGNSPVTGEFPAQRASNAENFSIWWCHHDDVIYVIAWRTVDKAITKTTPPALTCNWPVIDKCILTGKGNCKAGLYIISRNLTNYTVVCVFQYFGENQPCGNETAKQHTFLWVTMFILFATWSPVSSKL